VVLPYSVKVTRVPTCLQKGSDNPLKNKVGKITKEQIMNIVKTKMDDLNAHSEEAAAKIIEGSCRSMGVEIVD